MPPLCLADVALHLTVEVFDAVRALEAAAQFREQAQSVERHRLFEPFLKRTGGPAVNLAQFRFQLHQPLFDPLVARFLTAVPLPSPPDAQPRQSLL